MFMSNYTERFGERGNEWAYRQSCSDHTHQSEVEFSASSLAVVLLWYEIIPLRHKRKYQTTVTEMFIKVCFPMSYLLLVLVPASQYPSQCHTSDSYQRIILCVLSSSHLDCPTFSHYCGLTFSSSQVAKCVVPGRSSEHRSSVAWLAH